MHGNREDPRIIPENTFGTVAVVRINIDVDDSAESAVQKPGNGQCRIVVNAEATRPVAGGMMHAAAKIDCAESCPCEDRVGAQQGTPRQTRGCIVHPREGRVILCPEPVRNVHQCRFSTHGPDGCDKVLAVHCVKFDVGRYLRCSDINVRQFEQAKALDHACCQVQASGRHRVARAEVVSGHGLIPRHYRRRSGFTESGQEGHHPQATRAMRGQAQSLRPH